MATIEGSHILTSGKSSVGALLWYGTITHTETMMTVPVAVGGKLSANNHTSASISYTLYGAPSDKTSGTRYWSTSNSTSHGDGTSWWAIDNGNKVYFVKEKTSYSAQVVATLSTNGKTSTATYNFTVPPITNYAINYDSMGGTPVESQTKWFNEGIILSSTIPTKDGWHFLGWSTSSNAETVNYSAGATYTTDAPLQLYAVWELAKDVRAGKVVSAVRTNSSGVATDDGTYFKVVCTYSLLGVDANTGTVSAKYKKTSATSWTNVANANISPRTTTKGTDKTSLEVTVTISGVSGLSQDSSYDIQITVTDSGGHTATMNTFISQAYFTLDFQKGGKGIGVGVPMGADVQVPSNGLLKVGMDAEFDGAVKIGSDTLTDYVVEQGTDGIWTYRKWSSGIAECWGRKDITVTGGSVWTAPLYYSTQSTGQISYPFTFSAIPTELVSISSSTNAVWQYKENSPTGNTTSATANYRAIKVGSFNANQTITFCFEVKGRWK